MVVIVYPSLIYTYAIVDFLDNSGVTFKHVQHFIDPFSFEGSSLFAVASMEYIPIRLTSAPNEQLH